MKIKIKHPVKSFSKKPKILFSAFGESKETENIEAVQKPKKNNKKQMQEIEGGNDMLTQEQLREIEAAAESMKPEVKVLKKDKGLIERTESSKIVITEDNRQVLND